MTDATYADQAAELFELARGIAAKLSMTPHDAEEIAQESVTRAAANWDRIGGYAPRWIVRVATNLSLDRHRESRRVFPLGSAEIEAGGDDIDSRVDIERAIRTLPVRQRQVVALRFIADLSEREVAEQIGCSTGAVKRHMHRAKIALRRELAGLEPTYHDREGSMTVTEGFIAANEPDGGWAARPWDHWLIESPDGDWDRVAVDKHGEPVIDGDGDEVMSGPGFDHAVVKITPGSGLGAPRPMPSLDRFDPELAGAIASSVEEAAFHGHPWVGTEHLALALSRRYALDERLGEAMSVTSLDESIAAFYEGPWAAERASIVRARRNGEGFVRQEITAFSWNNALHESLDATQGSHVDDVLRALFGNDHSLPLTLLSYVGRTADLRPLFNAD